MGPRFKVTFFVLLLLFSIGTLKNAAAAQTDQNSEGLEMIAKRMRSLTNSLEKIPQPPAFNQKIELPDSILKIPQKEASTQTSRKEKQ